MLSRAWMVLTRGYFSPTLLSLHVFKTPLISFRCGFSLSAFQQLDVSEAAFLAPGKAILLKYRGSGCVQFVHRPFWREKFRGWFLF